MKYFPKNILLVMILVIFLGCNPAVEKQQSPNYTSSSPTSSVSTAEKILPVSTPKSTPDISNDLTKEKVETAVAKLLTDWRLGGSVRVKGVQELPQQNAAVADLQFDNFEYGVTNEGGLVKAKDFAPKPMPKDQSSLPSMEEMFPQRKIIYSKDGKATLSHYTDGRWVLKEVRWGLDTGITGTVEIR